METPVIVGIGEVLWDVFSDGPRFGGAPTNFACSVAGLAADSAYTFIVSAVGCDELGELALKELATHCVDASHVSSCDKQTGQVLVTVDAGGQASYEFAADTAWDNLEWSDELANLASRSSAVCFGTLGQRNKPSREVIQRFIASTPAQCLRIFDINLRSPFWDDELIRQSLPLANVLKCNEDELPVLATLFDLRGNDKAMLSQLIERFSLRLVALTRGESGSLLLNESGESSELASVETTVADTVGAGDSFTAAIALGMMRGFPTAVTHEWASRVAAFVCSQPGATPRMPSELRVLEETC